MMNEFEGARITRITPDNTTAWFILPHMYVNPSKGEYVERLNEAFVQSGEGRKKGPVSTTLDAFKRMGIMTNEGNGKVTGFWRFTKRHLRERFGTEEPTSPLPLPGYPGPLTPQELATMYYVRDGGRKKRKRSKKP